MKFRKYPDPAPVYGVAARTPTRHRPRCRRRTAAHFHRFKSQALGNTIRRAGVSIKETAVTEKGAVVNGRGDTPNTHDILTGSQPDGTAFPAGKDMTCGNWTKGGGQGAAMLGHHDRIGLRDDESSRSWNSSHPSRGGCSPDVLKSSGGCGPASTASPRTDPRALRQGTGGGRFGRLFS